LVLVFRARKTISTTDDQLIPFIKDSLKFVVVLFSIFIVLGSILHVNVASLIAGLGIGGIAIALAAKETLENLLGSFTIFLDKPFTLGDQVRVGSSFGKVERIGFRSTQIRTQEKTLITVPNKKMIDMEVENISLREMIRAAYPLTIHYSTSASKTEELCSRLLAYLSNRDDVSELPAPIVRVERLSDSGIELNCLYFILDRDFEKFAASRAEILIQTLKISEELDIRLEAKQQEGSTRR
jgi:MscS family membrane protein